MTTHVAAGSRSAAQLSEIKIPQLPLREHGLTNVPAIPLDFVGMLDTLIKLGGKVKQREQALQGLSKTITIGGSTAPAYAFLFGREAADTKAAVSTRAPPRLPESEPFGTALQPGRQTQSPGGGAGPERQPTSGDDLTTRSLDDPKQWSMGWTTFPDVYTLGLPHLDEWAATVDVTQPDKATEAFFPTIARYGRSYNLILTKKVKSRDVAQWRDLFGSAWTPALDAAAEAGLLYVIDLRIYETLKPQQVAGFPRFTPSTVTVLVQDAATKALTPELIRVAGGDNQPKIFSRRGSTTPSAWVYALQAAKVSVTVYGIWLGHVYHWHLVTAAMLMTMFENLSAKNPARKLLEPQSSYLIPFDDVLLLGWGSLAEVPPTSIATGWQFLELIDLFAKDRAVLRRRSDDHVGTARHRRVRLHGQGAVGPVSPRRRPAGDLDGNWPLREHLRRPGLSDRSGRAARPGASEVDRRIRSSAGRQRPWPAGHGFEGCAEAGAPQPRVPHHGARRLPPVPQRESSPHVRRQLPALPPGRHDPRSDRQLRYKGIAPVPPQHRHDRIDAPLLLRLLGYAHLRALRADRRNRNRPVLRRRR